MPQQTVHNTPDVILSALEQHKDALRALGVRTLGLFGSARRGDTHAGSDLDFLVTLERPTFRSYMAVKEQLQAIFGLPVDLVIADAIKPRIRERVLAEVVYVAGLSPLS
ncbi:MAG: nucleotidyltransferase family protein [Ktedonobacterales bacterium]